MTESGPLDTLPLPPQSDFFHAILRYLTGNPDGSSREDVHGAMPELLQLTESQRMQRLRNLPHLRYRYRTGRRARKGVFITTSTFTRDAREFGRQIAESVVLIDGARLATLMIEHGVGVTHYRVLRLPRVDGDYFDAD